MKHENPAQEKLKAALVADLAAGMTYLDAHVKHGAAIATAAKWWADSGLTRTPAPTRKALSPEKRKAVERMLRDGIPFAEIRSRAGVGLKAVQKVRDELKEVPRATG